MQDSAFEIDGRRNLKGVFYCEVRVFLTLLGNFLQRNYYTFCSQINEIYLYVFQRRLKICWDRKKWKLVALHTLKHSRF